jgi:hypothetical protein
LRREMKLQDWVPWVVALGNCSSLYLTTRGKPSGFWVLILAQIVFAVYVLFTGQPGFLVQNAAMTVMAIAGIVRWRRQGVHYSRKDTHGNPSPNQQSPSQRRVS